MGVKFLRKFLKNEKGQAIFELVVFLPFLVFLYTTYYTLGNSINGSINQQKATRRYLFYLLKGNSRALVVKDLQSYVGSGIQSAGNFAVGWREKSSGATGGASFATCYRFNTLFASEADEECDGRNSEISSNFIKVFTFFGVCGENYSAQTGSVLTPVQSSGFYGNCRLSGN